MTDVNDPAALMAEVQNALMAGDNDRAELLARIGVNAGVTHPNLMTLAAHGFWREGRGEEALSLLQGARDRSPRDANIHHLLGLVLASLGRNREAAQAFEATIAAEPAFAPAYFHYGALRQAMGEIESARALYQKAAELAPDYAEPRAALSMLDGDEG